MKKFLSILLCLVLVTSAIFAQGTEETSEEANGKDQIVVDFLVKKLSSAFWTDMVDAAQAQCDEYGYELNVLCPITADSNEEQIQLIEQSLLDPPDIFLIAAADSEGITPAIEEINEAGIPIVAVSAKLLGEGIEYVTFVGIEFKDLAIGATEALCKKLNYKGNVLYLQGVPGASSSMGVDDGAYETFAKYPDITVLASEPANYQRQEGMTVTQNLLQKYSNVDGILAANGESALGCVEAIRQLGREGIQVTTINSSKELIQAIVAGKLYALADDVSWKVGQQGVVCAKKSLDGETLPKDNLQQPVMVTADSENLSEYIERYGIK